MGVQKSHDMYVFPVDLANIQTNHSRWSPKYPAKNTIDKMNLGIQNY